MKRRLKEYRMENNNLSKFEKEMCSAIDRAQRIQDMRKELNSYALGMLFVTAAYGIIVNLILIFSIIWGMHLWIKGGYNE